MRRTPMSRGKGFQRPAYARPARGPLTPVTRGVVVLCTGMALAAPKCRPVVSEAYRRLVAALPCIHCNRWNQSQAAHPPPTGKGIKEDDRECFPLCCTGVLRTGCHVEFDQYRLIPQALMRDQAAQWGAKTRATIIAAGQWPARLPRWAEISFTEPE